MRVSGLRGCPEPFELELAEKSMCVLGENGHGKTTLADALELFGDGDLTAYHRRMSRCWRPAARSCAR
jgi:recombinational DNA repair ATPase RecF